MDTLTVVTDGFTGSAFDCKDKKNIASAVSNTAIVSIVSSVDTVSNFVSSVIVSTASRVSIYCKHSKNCNLTYIV